jgi:hypothetical protein
MVGLATRAGIGPAPTQRSRAGKAGQYGTRPGRTLQLAAIASRHETSYAGLIRMELRSRDHHSDCA